MDKEKYIQKTSMNKDIDFKEIFSILKRYYKSLISITILVMFLSSTYAYFATNIYQSQTLVQLGGNENKTMKADFMATAEGNVNSRFEDEMASFSTRRLIGRALENLNLSIRYFTKKNLKSYELYKDSPFIVTFEYLSKNAMNLPFRLIPTKDGQSFRLVTEPTLKKKIVNTIRSFIKPLPADEQPIVYDKVHKFGEKIETQWFTITIQKVFEFENDDYFFTMLPKKLITKFIQENISVSQHSKDSAIIVLTFQDNVPLRAKEVLDMLSSVYIQETMENRSKSANRKLHFIDMQLEAIDKTLKSSAQNLEQYKATNIVVDLGSKVQITSEKMNQLETQLDDINMRIDVMENILNYIETHKDIKGINIDSAFRNATLAGSAIQNIILEIQKVTAQRIDLLTEFTTRHPNVIKVDRQLISLRNSLKEAILNSLNGFKKHKQSLSYIIQESKAKMQTLPVQERELTRLTRNFRVNEKIYSFLLEKRAQTAIIESSSVSEINIFESAAIADKPIYPKRVLILLGGILLGFILGIMQAKLRSYLDNTIKSVEDIKNLTTIPIYGILPALKQKVLKLEVLKDPKSPFAESYRSLRTNLQFSQKGDKANVVLVTSIVSGEGKSTTAANLGAIFQMANYKSIVINLDLRKPTIHHYFNVSNKSGMSTYLSGKSNMNEIIQSTQYNNLDVITSGPIPPNPSELILTDKLDMLLNDLKEIYDYIFIDSAPLGLVTDTMHLMQYADTSLIVFRENHAKKSFVTDLNNIVEKHDLKHMGIVINSADISSGSYGYGYGYGYGYEGKD
ncbi:polysaccharide biosynthesis tyrosine autokinase [Sulfurovum sp. AR]|uniref:GumC family protein n=1 Tax=Sulfurovum sp. AR TaxID=1165841 RepID=UPI00025C4F14|nr:polysaccharide biosynthesis tyrosine autokinase [Sulfurovum sp. AR]EIF51155.1 capsular polysaccharide biosynthesis protein [Sulfurovum sp. AR]